MRINHLFLVIVLTATFGAPAFLAPTLARAEQEEIPEATEQQEQENELEEILEENQDENKRFIYVPPKKGELPDPEPKAETKPAPTKKNINNNPSTLDTNAMKVDAGPVSELCGTLEDPTCSLFWIPAASFLVPGLGQSINGTTAYPYYAAMGLSLTGIFALSEHVDPDLLEADGGMGALTGGPAEQAWMLSASLYQWAGSLSAYDTYRHRMVDELGLQAELPHVDELLMAPLEFKRLASPSVGIPLVSLLALVVWDIQTNYGEGIRAFSNYTGYDAGTTMAISTGAGVTEEALFRGFMMSYMEHRWGWNRWVANGVQGTLFGAAHGTFDARILMGFYFGWMAQRDNYDLRDAVFLHTWWDVIAISALFAVERATYDEVQPAIMWLPAMVF
ncbi:CPBP family intramembrane metalloprotease [Myxococcota bacterium]|nr:CPBP family intramembrane metalloprotease [Myxococcota bacterium]